MKKAWRLIHYAHKPLAGLLLGGWFACIGTAYSASVEMAKTEGELVWWTTIAQDQSQKIIEAFMKKYPFIKANYWRSGSNGVHNKIVTEARVNRHSWDVVTYGAEFVTELRQKNLLAAYDSPERKHYSDDLKDDNGHWTAIYALPIGLGYNTNLVKKEEVPTSYDELLKTKKKGWKISIDNEGESLLMGLMQAWGRERAIQYLEKLATQDLVPGRGNTRRAQAVAAGEFPLLIAYTHSIEWFKLQGAPVDWVNLDPAVIQINPVMLSAHAAHPNSGKLFIDFILSKEGQTLLQSFHRVTTRDDVKPKPARLFEGFKRIVLHPEDPKILAEGAKLYRKIFGLQ
ncbi:MAG: ABC transporter substrate-binding protein [Candidatus Binatia bacterium]